MTENMKVIPRNFKWNLFLFVAFVDVVQDCALMEDLGENLYKNKEIFIMHEYVSHLSLGSKNDSSCSRNSLMCQMIIETEKRL